jgi:NAD(P)-dependent dehydrogenase (short-subunit alcohol dehydrogenase family)
VVGGRLADAIAESPAYSRLRRATALGRDDSRAILGALPTVLVAATSALQRAGIAYLPPCRTAGGGSIINISSIMGFVGGSSGHPAYCASKGAIRI